MSGSRDVALGDVVSSLGGLWGKAESDVGLVEVMAIRGTDFASVRRGELSNVPRRFEKEKAVAKRLLDARSIIIEASGGSKDQPVGRSMLIRHSLLDGSPIPVSAASFCKIFWVDTEVADPRYMQAVLEDLYISGAIEQYQTQSTGLRNLRTRQLLSDFRFELPPMETQRRIAAVLSAFDELIEINERRIELLEDLARSLYREWFVHFRFPGHEDVEMVDSALGPIPEGWEVGPLNELVTTQYGFTASASLERVGPRFLRGMDINKTSYIDWSAVPFCEIDSTAHGKFKLQKGDVCVIRMADPGKVGIVESEVDGVFASYLVRIRSQEPRLPPYLLFHFMDSPEYQDWITGSSTGSTRKSASSGVLTEPVVRLPKHDLATKFQAHVAKIRENLALLVEGKAQLVVTRDLLLPRLVSGQLDISDLDLGTLTPPEVE